MQTFKIRCSQIGQIMTNDRTGKTIGKTAETYLKMWIKSQLYGKSIEIKSKYLDKGNICEDDSIDFIASKLKMKLQKNELFFENDFFTGTPDLITDDFVIDVKNSWNWETFPLFEEEFPNLDYYDQLQGYMDLTGKRKAKLIYILSDTPEHLIEREAFYKVRELGLPDLDEEMFEEFKAKMTYTNTPDHLKFKVFDFDYDENRIKEIKERVNLCRYIIETKFNYENNN